MKLYCFLLIIIILILLYDNNLYEGNEQTDGFIPDFLSDILMGDNENSSNESISNDSTGNDSSGNDSNASDCNLDEDCSQNLIQRDMNWGYNTNDTGKWGTNKHKCVDCLKCKTAGGALIDSYYGHICDAIVGCLDSPSEYSNNKMPYIYAYKHSDWSKQCQESEINKITDEKEKSAKNTTCKILNDNSLLDTMSMMYLDLQQHACDTDVGSLLC
jgi:hypothetical protein